MSSPSLLVRKLRLVALVPLGVALVAAILYLVFAQYRTQMALQQTALRQVAYDSERRATALGYFFTEQRDVLQDLAQSRELTSYFENKALGMSFEYGLKASLFFITEHFDQVRLSKRLGGQAAYERLAFLSAGGRLLSDSRTSARAWNRNRNWRKLTTPSVAQASLLCDQEDGDLHLIISAPAFFKGRYAGQVLGWISFHDIYNYFIEQKNAASHFPDAVLFNSAYLCVPASAKSILPPGNGALPPDLQAGQPYPYLIHDNNADARMAHAILVPVEGTPFSLLTLVPPNGHFTLRSIRHPLYLTAGLALLIIGGTLLLAALYSRNAVLRTHLEDTLAREHAVDGKNRELAAEIGERRSAEASLQKERDFVESLFETAQIIMLVLDPEGRIERFNPYLESVSGYRINEVRGQDWYSVFVPEADQARLRQLFLTTMQTFLAQRIAYPILTKDGRTLEIEWQEKTIHDAGGRLIGLLSIGQDVTERRQVEAERAKLQNQLQQTQKMESLGVLAGGIAHDMNNVLGAILGLASAHLETQLPGSTVHRAFNIISEAATRGGKMVRSLLSFARSSPAEERPLDMNLILREEVGLLERTTLAKIRLNLDLAPNLLAIHGDVSALSHACLNLCVNAMEAMPPNGTLTLRTRNLGADWIEVRVEDTGTGMSEEVRARAMDPFFTTKAVGKGTGLGLSLVYSTVKAHHGDMELHSEPGQGTCVSLRFPAFAAVGPAPAAALEPVAGASRALNVLVVDDDVLIQEAIQGVLDYLGHRVCTVSNGEQALAKLEEGLRPEVVVLDMNMPGLGGVGTLVRLRNLLPEVPVILATGRADQTALDLVERIPHVALLAKPFSIKELRPLLEALKPTSSSP